MTAQQPILLEADGMTAQACRHGGHVTQATLAGQPLLFLATHGIAPGMPIRGGVPVIFPWFGDDPERRGRPAHGFARRRAWRRLDAGLDPAAIEFELSDDLQTLALWPHHFGLRLRAQLRGGLQIELRVENRGTTPMRCEPTLHTYLAVGDIAQTAVFGLRGARYHDKVRGGEHLEQADAVRFAGEVDRTYFGTDGDCAIVDRALQRTLRVSKSGSRSTVIWNPGAARAAQFRDLTGDEWRRFVCVESGNIGPDAIDLAPGATHTMTVWIGVR